MEPSISSLSLGSSRPASANNISSSNGRWFSLHRLFRDFRRYSSQRHSRKVSTGESRNDVVMVNSSCSINLQDEEIFLSGDPTSVLIECPVCTIPQPPAAFPEFKSASCRHRTCAECIHHYFVVEITESRTDIPCPVCAARIHPDDIRTFLKDDPILLNKYEEFSLRRALVVDPDIRWCPAPDCG